MAKLRSKYGNKKVFYCGRCYDSIKERDYAVLLDWLKKSGEVLDWEPQVPITMSVNGLKICTYKIDFVVAYKSGEIHYVEVKGYETATWRLKWKLAKALYPDYKFVLVK